MDYFLRILFLLILIVLNITINKASTYYCFEYYILLIAYTDVTTLLKKHYRRKLLCTGMRGHANMSIRNPYSMQYCRKSTYWNTFICSI